MSETGNTWSWGSGKIWISKPAAEWIKKTYPGLLEEHGYWGYPDDSDSDQRCVCACGERLDAEDDAARALFEHVGEVVAARIEKERQEALLETKRQKALLMKEKRQRQNDSNMNVVTADPNVTKAKARALARAKQKYGRGRRS